MVTFFAEEGGERERVQEGIKHFKFKVLNSEYIQKFSNIIVLIVSGY